jgi:type I restriction enzyme M protein
MTTKKDIENALMRGADSLRDTLNVANYKDYVLPIMFFKYMEEASFQKLFEQRNNKNLGELINTTFRKIEKNNPHQLAGVFSIVDYNSETNFGKSERWNAILRELLEIFVKLDLQLSQIEVQENQKPADVISDVIVEFIGTTGKWDGFIYTPAAVSEIIARIVNIQNGEKIYDPACGSGSLLIKAAKWQDKNQISVYGQEINGFWVSVVKMNMFIHQINDARIAWGNTLANPLFLDSKGDLMLFDVIVANIPFTTVNWTVGFNTGEEAVGKNRKKIKLETPMDKYRRFDWGAPPVNKGDWAFLLHMIASCAHQGRIAAIVPHGVLFRSGAEKIIRKRVIEENLLDAIIGLPENIFFGINIPTCILIFKRDRKNKDVVFIDASKKDDTGKPRYVKGRNQNILEEKHVNDIVQAYQKRKNIARFAHVAPLEKIIENKYNLNIPHYVDTFEEEKIINIEEVRQNIKRLKTEIISTEAKMDVYLKEMGL